MEKEQSNNNQKIVKLITRSIAILFFALSLYYIIWAAVRAEDFSSVIVYSSAIALSILAIERVVLNNKLFLVYLLPAVFLFIIGILGVNISSLFY